MNRKAPEDLDRILNEMDVDHVPVEFVKSARVVYLDGVCEQIPVEELEDIINREATLEELGIKDLGLVLDLEVIKSTIREYREIILQGIDS